MNPTQQALMNWINAPTDAQAVDAIIAIGVELRERYIPAMCDQLAKYEPIAWDAESNDLYQRERERWGA
jgi:hypothetical protein